MKPTIPKGTRDFLPSQVRKRKYIFKIIEDVFKKYGYAPIETPTMETLTTLSGKYGEEGDQLLFKVLNNGDFLSKVDDQVLSEKNSKKVVSSISKRGLRYDLTVPFARYVVMHQNEIQLPFKRYQIQPVWRADRPQKGRYQEFYQCDVDVVGSNSLMYEAELVDILDEVYSELNINVKIHVNNRKILTGIAEAAGVPDQFVAMTTAIDKLDKIGEDGVRTELTKREINEEAIDKIMSCLKITKLDDLEKVFAGSEIGLKGIDELRAFHNYFDKTPSENEVAFDPTLARGLSYYTGCIFEVKAKDVKMGSMSGGGRYDDLTGTFGLKNVSGVGVSFGAERIFDVMEELNLFPNETSQDIKIMFVAFDQESHEFAFKAASELRNSGIPCDIYPAPVKIQKQMKYINARKIPYAAIVGSEEAANESVTLKDMETGEQQMVNISELISQFS